MAIVQMLNSSVSWGCTVVAVVVKLSVVVSFNVKFVGFTGFAETHGSRKAAIMLLARSTGNRNSMGTLFSPFSGAECNLYSLPLHAIGLRVTNENALIALLRRACTKWTKVMLSVSWQFDSVIKEMGVFIS